MRQVSNKTLPVFIKKMKCFGSVKVANKKTPIKHLFSMFYRSLSATGAGLLLNSLTIFIKTAMHSLLSIYVLAKSAISECFIEIHESFPYSFPINDTKPTENQWVLYHCGA